MRKAQWCVVIIAALASAVAVRGQDKSAPAPAPKDCSATYANFGRSFMERYCLRCHSSTRHNFFTRRGAPKKVDYDDYAGVKKKAGKIADETVLHDEMPRGRPKPTAEERKRLGDWIDCGLPE